MFQGAGQAAADRPVGPEAMEQRVSSSVADGARIERLKRRADFLRAASARRRWVAPGLVLQARARAPGEGPEAAVRLGFTASRKVGGAVERNRARRRLSAAAAAVLPALARPGFDYVLIARPETLRRPFAALLEDLRAGLKRLDREGARREGCVG